jgi:pSer/pThr/pTyr-binding forkhead associated (FHA) protein
MSPVVHDAATATARGKTAMGKLVHIVDGVHLREYQLNEGVFKIGRNVGNDIQLDDATASGYNTEVSVKPSQYMEGLLDVWLKDLQSTNGTKVNGKRTKKCMLKHDDIVQIGTQQFKFIDEHQVLSTRTRILLDE